MYDFDQHLEARKIEEDGVCYIKTFVGTLDQARQKLRDTHVLRGNMGVTEDWNIAGDEIPREKMEEVTGSRISQFCAHYKVVWMKQTKKKNLDQTVRQAKRPSINDVLKRGVRHPVQEHNRRLRRSIDVSGSVDTSSNGGLDVTAIARWLAERDENGNERGWSAVLEGMTNDDLELFGRALARYQWPNSGQGWSGLLETGADTNGNLLARGLARREWPNSGQGWSGMLEAGADTNGNLLARGRARHEWPDVGHGWSGSVEGEVDLVRQALAARAEARYQWGNGHSMFGNAAFGRSGGRSRWNVGGGFDAHFDDNNYFTGRGSYDSNGGFGLSAGISFVI